MGMLALILSRILAWVCFAFPQIGLDRPSAPTCPQQSASGWDPPPWGVQSPSNPGPRGREWSQLLMTGPWQGAGQARPRGPYSLGGGYQGGGSPAVEPLETFKVSSRGPLWGCQLLVPVFKLSIK